MHLESYCVGCEITVKAIEFQLLVVKMFLTITAYHKPRKRTCTDQDVPSGASSCRVCPELTEQRKENTVMIIIDCVRDLAWLGGPGVGCCVRGDFFSSVRDIHEFRCL